MHRLWEILLGLDKGFLGREGELHWHFNPHWPLQRMIGAASWNLLLGVAIAVLVYQVYRREGRSRQARYFATTIGDRDGRTSIRWSKSAADSRIASSVAPARMA